MPNPTPVPWVRVYGPHGNHPVEIIAGGKVIARVVNGPGLTAEECRANASLVAAAPELLAACEALLAFVSNLDNDIEHPGDRDAASKIGESAIRKARGE